MSLSLTFLCRFCGPSCDDDEVEEEDDDNSSNGFEPILRNDCPESKDSGRENMIVDD